MVRSCGINKIGIFLRDTQYYKYNVNYLRYLLEYEYIPQYIIYRFIPYRGTAVGTVGTYRRYGTVPQYTIVVFR